ncbi:MAG: hypothetical protein JXQ65_16045 [Candidatus Marinimicrobia bacterium]|nr:hypothetical protein [Candidatus Neomarinimicrobiota bacterium]
MKQKFNVWIAGLIVISLSITLFAQATSPYYGWFKGKTEFSFASKSTTSGKVGNMNTETVVNSLYIVKNGYEGLKEVSVMSMNGKAMPENEKIYITSENANYVINPATKQYFKDKGDYTATYWSKVWQWTRKRSDSYDNIAKAFQPTLNQKDGQEIENYTISSVVFSFNKDKQLLQYSGTAGGMNTVIEFFEYSDKVIGNYLEDMIQTAEKEYIRVEDFFAL